MDFPGGLSPRIVIPVRANSFNGSAYIGGAIVFVIPKPIADHPNLACRMAGCLIIQVECSKESREFLNSNFVFVDRVLGAWTDLANDRSRVARLGRTFGWFFEKFEMPIMEI